MRSSETSFNIFIKFLETTRRALQDVLNTFFFEKKSKLPKLFRFPKYGQPINHCNPKVTGSLASFYLYPLKLDLALLLLL